MVQLVICVGIHSCLHLHGVLLLLVIEHLFQLVYFILHLLHLLIVLIFCFLKFFSNLLFLFFLRLILSFFCLLKQFSVLGNICILDANQLVHAAFILRKTSHLVLEFGLLLGRFFLKTLKFILQVVDVNL